MARLSSRTATHLLGTLILSFCLFYFTVALSNDRDNILGDIGKLEQSIKKSTTLKASLEKRASTLKIQIDNLRIQAAKVAQHAQKLETTLSKIDRRISQLAQEKKLNQRRLIHVQADLIQSVVALVRLQRRPAATILVETETLLDTVRVGRLFAKVVPILREDAIKLRGLLSSTNDVHQKLKAEQRRRKKGIAALSTRRIELNSLLNKRASRERRLRKAGEAEEKRLAKLASKATNLNSLIKRLEQDASSAQIGFSQLSIKRVPRQNAQSAKPHPSKLAAEISRTVVTSNSKFSKSGRQWRNHNSPEQILPRQNLALMSPTQPFSELRGRLRIPAHGKQISKFGENSSSGARSQGITLRTRQRAQVVAPHGGRVVFAGPFRNYGLILIIAHGEGYHTLLAGLSTLQAVVGQNLLVGEPMGTMGGDNNRSLYIELRHKGKPINPNPWWSLSRERVSG